MQYSTVTHKGQVTIPIDIRKALEIKEGDKVAFTKVGNKIAISVKHKVNLMDLYGYLPKPSKALSIEEINRIIESKK